MPRNGKNIPISPLHWPFDWNHLPSWQTFLSAIPVVGPQARAYRAVVRQLKLRPNWCFELWDGYSEVERHLSKTIARIAQVGLGWPNAHFIPADPFEIIVWDRYGDLATSGLLTEIEAEAGLRRRTTAEWESLMGTSFGEVVRALSQDVSATVCGENKV